MNTVFTFQFEDHDVRVVMDEQSNFWFVGRDICFAHGLKNPNVVMRYSKSDWIPKYLSIKDRLGRDRGVRVLTLAETLELTRRLAVPVPKFEFWVVNEVVPQLQSLLTKNEA